MNRLGVVLTGPADVDLPQLQVMLHCLAAQWRKPEVVVYVHDGPAADLLPDARTDKSSKHLSERAAFVAVHNLRNYLLKWMQDKMPSVNFHFVVTDRDRDAARICWPSKQLGFALLYDFRCRYGCALDTDGDYVPPYYLERLEKLLEAQPRAAVAVPLTVQFEARTAVLGTAKPDLSRTNCAPSTSMVRLAALRQIGGWVAPWPMYAFCDWATWRRLLARGWEFCGAAFEPEGSGAKPAEYYWRRHDKSVSFTSPGHQQYWAQTIDWTDLITIAVPLAGRNWCLQRLLQALEVQTIPQRLCRIVLVDNSDCPKFRDHVLQWLSRQGYRGKTWALAEESAGERASKWNEIPSNYEVADGDRWKWEWRVNDRVAGAWAQISRIVQTDLVWCVEDDVIPPPDALERLLHRFTLRTDAVSAMYRCRRSNQPVAWHIGMGGQRSMAEVGTGLERVDGVGLGCVLLRRHLLAPVAWAARADEWYDVGLWRYWSQQQPRAELAVDWSVVAEHLKRGEGRGARGENELGVVDVDVDSGGENVGGNSERRRIARSEKSSGRSAKRKGGR